MTIFYKSRRGCTITVAAPCCVYESEVTIFFDLLYLGLKFGYFLSLLLFIPNPNDRFGLKRKVSFSCIFCCSSSLIARNTSGWPCLVAEYLAVTLVQPQVSFCRCGKVWGADFSVSLPDRQSEGCKSFAMFVKVAKCLGCRFVGFVSVTKCLIRCFGGFVSAAKCLIRCFGGFVSVAKCPGHCFGGFVSVTKCVKYGLLGFAGLTKWGVQGFRRLCRGDKMGGAGFLEALPA